MRHVRPKIIQQQIPLNPMPVVAKPKRAASLNTVTIICGRRVYGPHDGIPERLRVQFDLRRPFPGGSTPGEADADRHLGVRDRRVRQRAGVHRAADGVSSAGESSGTHPRHRAGDVRQDPAAFANTVLVRYLDCNDHYAARGTGHPSDMIPGVLAVAGGHRLDGRAAITAITAAYEVFCRLADEVLPEGLGPRDVRSHRGDLRRRHDPRTGPEGHGERHLHCDHHRCAAGSDAGRRAFDVEGLRNGGCSPNRSVRGRAGNGCNRQGRANLSKDGTGCGSTWGSKPQSGKALEAELSRFGSPVPTSRRTRR